MAHSITRLLVLDVADLTSLLVISNEFEEILLVVSVAIVTMERVLPFTELLTNPASIERPLSCLPPPFLLGVQDLVDRVRGGLLGKSDSLLRIGFLWTDAQVGHLKAFNLNLQVSQSYSAFHFCYFVVLLTRRNLCSFF